MEKKFNSTLLDALKVDTSSPGMLYQKLASNIKLAIEKGILSEGEFLPPQRNLASDLDVSRVTVSKAIDELAKQGVVKLIPRQGVQIEPYNDYSPVPPKLHLSDQYNFTKDMQARDMKPSTHWITKENCLASTQEALALGIPQNSQVGHYWRLRFADDKPLAIEVACVPSSVIADSGEVDDSLYDTLKSKDSLPIRAMQTITARPADKRTAKYLEVPEGSAVLYIERRGFDSVDRCVEYTRYWYLGDRYCFIADMTLDVNE
ncbi:GntR family transcriptional regulator [Vibrio sp. F74]|uniref:GntR family transcriptional regulator n=1 Tax=Vibrio sp. F74 TaxID=700020 RepID=UPI0035F53E5E